MRAIAVVEGAMDASVLSEALSLTRRGREPRVEVLTSGSVSGAASLARSLLLEPATSVALVLDAESVEGEDLEERRRYLSTALDDVRTTGWEIFLLTGLSRGPLNLESHTSKALEAIGDFFWPSKSPHQIHQRLEARLLESLTSWLESQGWAVRAEAERGVDVIATRGRVVLRIETKVSSTTGHGRNEVNRVGEAVYQAMSWLATRDGFVAIAVTDTPGFRRAIGSVEGPLRLLGVGVFLVASDGSVVEHIPLTGVDPA